jgi:hypothetical protein
VRTTENTEYWPTVNGTILKTQLLPVYHGPVTSLPGSKSWELQAVYRYTVEGVEYESREIGRQLLRQNRQQGEALFARFLPGTEIEVYTTPASHPNRCSSPAKFRWHPRCF